MLIGACAFVIAAAWIGLRYKLEAVQKQGSPLYLYCIYSAAFAYIHVAMFNLYGAPESNLITIKVTANLWFLLFLTTFVQNELQLVTLYRGVQGLSICSLVFVFVGLLSFSPKMGSESKTPFLTVLIQVLFCTMDSLILCTYLLHQTL